MYAYILLVIMNSIYIAHDFIVNQSQRVRDTENKVINAADIS